MFGRAKPPSADPSMFASADARWTWRRLRLQNPYSYGEKQAAIIATQVVAWRSASDFPLFPSLHPYRGLILGLPDPLLVGWSAVDAQCLFASRPFLVVELLSLASLIFAGLGDNSWQHSLRPLRKPTRIHTFVYGLCTQSTPSLETTTSLGAIQSARSFTGAYRGEKLGGISSSASPGALGARSFQFWLW